MQRLGGHSIRHKAALGAILVAVCLMYVSAAHADTHGTVDLKYLGRGSVGALWDRINVKVDMNRDGSWDWNRSDATAGEFPFRWDGDDSNLLDSDAKDAFNTNPNNPYIYAYCIDVDDRVGPKRYYTDFEVLDLPGMHISGTNRNLSAASAAYLTEHFARHYGLVDTPEEAASFATVVWEIMYEDAGAYDRSSGWVRTGDPGFSSTWLGELDGTVFDNTKVYALVDKCYQDMAMPVFGVTGGSGPIPEPITLMGVVLAAGGVSTYVRKRRRMTAG